MREPRRSSAAENGLSLGEPFTWLAMRLTAHHGSRSECNSHNDERGHAAGDDVLRVVTEQWSRLLRPVDSLYRSGGDEFVLLLPDTREPEAEALLRRLRDGSATGWCFGTTEVHPDDDLDMALARADLRLYTAKSARPLVVVPTPRQDEGSSPHGRSHSSTVHQ